MSIKLNLAPLLCVGGLLLFSLACGGGPATPTPTAVPKPDIPATIAALAQRAEVRTATPTPVSSAVREVMVDFARGQRAIAQDWDRLHSDLDGWREGLKACDASAVQVALQQFGGRSARITGTARGLPRPPAVRELADKLVLAAEKEAEAFRQLRDTWDPGKPSVFQQVDSARSAASGLLKEVEDGLSIRQERTTPASRAQVDKFATALQELNSAWDKFHKDYDSFRQGEGTRARGDTVAELSKLAAQFQEIVVTIRGLPTVEATRQVLESIARAAEDEDLAIRRLNDSLREPAGASAPAKESAGSKETAPSGFAAFDAQLVKSNTLRRQALQVLADVQLEVAEPGRTALAEFTKQYGLLRQDWDKFHQEYDDWRRTEGGCDRAEAIVVLGGFTVRFGELTTRVRGLPRAAFLRPLGELLAEAAEREEEGLRGLRNTWRPFDAAVYTTFDRERAATGKLRRQVAVGTQDLLDRYGVSPQDLEKR